MQNISFYKIKKQYSEKDSQRQQIVFPISFKLWFAIHLQIQMVAF